MKIYTKTGDLGTTGLFAGPRVDKDDARICAYGTVDELCAALGVVAASLAAEIKELNVIGQPLEQSLLHIQSDLFCIGAELATPDPDANSMRLLSEDRILQLEQAIDAMEQRLPELTHFILPGGHPTAAQMHLARTICRRAEREVVSLSKLAGTSDLSRVMIYLNRLGDFLFVLARFVNARQNITEPQWIRPSPAGD